MLRGGRHALPLSRWELGVKSKHGELPAEALQVSSCHSFTCFPEETDAVWFSGEGGTPEAAPFRPWLIAPDVWTPLQLHCPAGSRASLAHSAYTLLLSSWP